MKKAIFASLIGYAALLVAVVSMMVIFVSIDGNAQDNPGFFIAISITFGLFVALFVVIILLLYFYPKKLDFEYKDKITPFIKEHNEKYPGVSGRIFVSNTGKTVYLSFMMDDGVNDTYSFELKEKPITKTEPTKMSLNVISEIYGISAQASKDKKSKEEPKE